MQSLLKNLGLKKKIKFRFSSLKRIAIIKKMSSPMRPHDLFVYIFQKKKMFYGFILIFMFRFADPYQRAATVYWQSYAAPAQSPWGLPPDMAASPTASWALHPPVRSAFELPNLRADVTPYEDPTTHASKPACVISSPPPAMAEIKEERISPEPPSHVAEKVEPSIPLERAQPLDSSTAMEPASIRVRDNLTIGWVSRDPSIRSPSTSFDDENVPRSLSTGHGDSPAPVADYSGLQLLSDSIEQFVSADQSVQLANEPQTKEEQPCNDNVSAVEMAGNALDVLCAAALYQQSDSPQSSEPRDISPATSCPRPTGFQVEFDFRSKLAELQRKYKEKQKELSSLSKSECRSLFALKIVRNFSTNNAVVL